VFAVFEDMTPLVEGLSIDEAFLDVRGMERIAGRPLEIAVRLRRAVLEQVGLPITVGVARTKFLAKVASGVAKPDGLLQVRPDRELEFLHPLPIERLWGVGHVTADKLRGRGITTVGQVAQLPEDALVAMLGRASGRHLHALAHNRDPRSVETGRRRRSIGSQRALGRRWRPQSEIDATLVGLVDRVTRRLRTGRRVCRTVVLRLRFDDFTRATRSQTLPQATAETQTILRAARRLLAIHVVYEPGTANDSLLEELGLAELAYREPFLDALAAAGWKAEVVSSCPATLQPTPAGVLLEGAVIDRLPVEPVEAAWMLVDAA